MLWAKKLEEFQAALTKALGEFLKTRLPEVDAGGLAEDITRTATRVDMSRSATRLRRRLYSQWGHQFRDGELYRLGPRGLEVRPDLLQPDPKEVGDVHIDPARIMGVTKMMGVGGKKRLENSDRVGCVHVILNALFRATRSKLPALSERAVAVLMALHAVEALKEVPKDKVQDVVKRHLSQWGLSAAEPAAVDADLALLVQHGAIKDGGDKWKLAEKIVYPW